MLVNIWNRKIGIACACIKSDHMDKFCAIFDRFENGARMCFGNQMRVQGMHGRYFAYRHFCDILLSRKLFDM